MRRSFYRQFLPKGQVLNNSLIQSPSQGIHIVLLSTEVKAQVEKMFPIYEFKNIKLQCSLVLIPAVPSGKKQVVRRRTVINSSDRQLSICLRRIEQFQNHLRPQHHQTYITIINKVILSDYYLRIMQVCRGRVRTASLESIPFCCHFCCFIWCRMETKTRTAGLFVFKSKRQYIRDLK